MSNVSMRTVIIGVAPYSGSAKQFTLQCVSHSPMHTHTHPLVLQYKCMVCIQHFNIHTNTNCHGAGAFNDLLKDVSHLHALGVKAPIL